MRHIDAMDFRSKRVRITARYRTQGASKRVDFWARAQGPDSPPDGPGLGGDSHHLLADTDWTEESLAFDVPAECAWLEYGIGIAGPGKIWLEAAKLEVIDKNTARTETTKPAVDHGSVPGWMLAGDAPSDFAIAVDPAVKKAGHASGTIRSVIDKPKGFGTLMQQSAPTSYLGKRLKLSAMIKSENVASWAGLWMRIDGSGKRSLAFDNMQNRPIKGTTDWTRYDVVLDVASEATNLAFGVLLDGPGQVWIDDITFTVVKATVPVTGSDQKKRPQNLDFEQ
jgi:hypothetical protein